MHNIIATVVQFLLANFGAQAIWRAKQFGAQNNDINENNYGGMIETVQHSMIGEGRMG